MKLYYHQGACSLADHIALIEAGLPYDLVSVDLKAKTTEDGRDYRTVNPKGYVPALELDDGEVLTENIAVLSWIAHREGKLLPERGMAHWRALETVAFISTELHKNFKPFFNPAASEAEKAEAAKILTGRFEILDRQLGDRPFILGEEMTVADAYLFVMLMWAGKNGIDLPGGLGAYFERLKARPSVAQALKEEGLG